MTETTINHGVMNQTQGATQTPAPNPAGATSTDWTTGFNDDLRGYVQNKGFKDPSAVVEAYRNFEKLRGVPEDKLVKIPERSDAPEWQEVYKKLGRPEKPEEYSLAIPEGEEENPEFSKWAKNAFHKLGLTAKQGESFSQEWNNFTKELTANMENQAKAKFEQESNSLKKEWGAAYDQNTNIAKQAAKTFGVTEEALGLLENQVGFAQVMKIFHNVGTKIQPDQFISGDKGGGQFKILTPEAARNKINALKTDEGWIKRWADGSVEAKEELERLMSFAYPSESA